MHFYLYIYFSIYTLTHSNTHSPFLSLFRSDVGWPFMCHLSSFSVVFETYLCVWCTAQPLWGLNHGWWLFLSICTRVFHRIAVINKRASLESQWECVSGNVIQQFCDFTLRAQNHPLVQTEVRWRGTSHPSRFPEFLTPTSHAVEFPLIWTVQWRTQ